MATHRATVQTEGVVRELAGDKLESGTSFLGGGAPPTGVDDRHAEGAGAAGGRRADLPEPDDAERLPLDAGAEHEVHVPVPGRAGADQALALR